MLRATVVCNWPARVAILVLLLAAPACAGHARTKSGQLFEGIPARVQGLSLSAVQQDEGAIIGYPVLMIDDGMRRIFIPQRQVDEVEEGADLSKYETFSLKQHRTSRKPMLGSLEGFMETTEFNEFGQRTHTVNTSFGQKQLIVGIEKITPQLLYLTGINYEWEHAVSTTSIPPATLDAVLRKAIDPKNPEDRMAVARFYLQAGMYPQGAAELDALLRDFPERESNVAQLRQQLRQLQAKLILQELGRRKAAGQHRLAYESLAKFPTEEMSAAVLRQVREMTADYNSAREKADKALVMLGDLQSRLDDQNLVAAIAPLRSFVRDELNYDTLGRLDAFFNLAADESLAPAEKLALAYSGWVLGSADAVTDLNTAASLWKARLLVTEYLRAKSPQRKELLQQIASMEGVGTENIVKLIPLLPPIIETPDLQPAQPLSIEVDDDMPGEHPVYHVLLPEEYHPHHKYPLIVALHPAERPAPQELVWWGGTPDKPGQSSRRGYIVIAPEYAPAKTRAYDYDVAAHDIVLRSLNDARKRFRVDSDRVFLSGHGMGGDAAFDIGMSHPDLFAGVIPIAGVCDQYCKWYRDNANLTSWYVVGGELDLDRNTTSRDLTVLEHMMKFHFDLVFVEYVGRGYESYYEEIHRLFDWMELHRRKKYLKSFQLDVLRPSENRCQWVQAEGFPPNVTQSAVLAGKSRRRVVPMTLDVQVLPGDAEYTAVTVKSGAARHSLWFSPEVVDFNKRLRVRRGGQQKFNDFLKPNTATLLEDLRQRGDREMLFTARVDID
jgi:pimeloyl-ACP methyl ester carboxylesterase